MEPLTSILRAEPPPAHTSGSGKPGGPGLLAFRPSGLLAFSPDGTLLASAHDNGDVHSWEVGTGWHLKRLRGAQESMTAVVFIDDHHLAAAGRDVDAAPGLSLDDHGRVTGSAAQVREHGEDAMMVVRGGGGSGLVYVAS